MYAEALRRLAEAPENDYRRYLLLDGLEAYATLDEAKTQELGARLRTERYQGAQATAMTTFEKGQQAGLQQGLQQGQRATIRTLPEVRFGPLSPGAQERLDGLDTERLDAMAPALLEARSLQDRAWRIEPRLGSVPAASRRAPSGRERGWRSQLMSMS